MEVVSDIDAGSGVVKSRNIVEDSVEVIRSIKCPVALNYAVLLDDALVSAVEQRSICSEHIDPGGSIL